MERLKGLDGLRGFLAISVALTHAYSHFTGWGNGFNIFRYSTFAVDVFFILSGIVLYYNYRDKLALSFNSIFNFLKHRIFRLYPLYVLSLIFVPISLYISNGTFFPDWIGEYRIRSFAGDLTLLNNLGGFKPYLNQPTWSISSELYIASLVVLLSCLNISFALFFAVLSVVGFYYTGLKTSDVTQSYHLISGGMLRCMFGVSLGILSFRAVELLSLKGLLNDKILNFISFISVSAIFLIMIGVKIFSFEYFIACAIVSVGVCSLSRTNGELMAFFESDWVKTAGERSYSIYIIHTPLIYFMLTFKSSNQNLNIAIATISVAMVYWISKYTYKFIEKPFIRFSKKSL